MSAQPENRPDPAAAAGYRDATRLVSLQCAAGADLDEMQRQHDDVSARLLSDAQTRVGRAYAREYQQTAATLISDLRADDEAEQREKPEPGAPHPNPVLAAKGWQACPRDCGVYVREPHRELDREAG